MPTKFGTNISETIYGTNDGDLILGYDGNDWIFGYGDSDILVGMDGNDVLNGGAGADFLEGGGGRDFASYDGSPAGVSVNLKTGQGSGGDAQGDTLMNIEGVFGSAYNDVLVGDDGDNDLAGKAGNDTLIGGEGNDMLEGGEGNDSLKGGGGDDKLFAGFGDDYLDGGDGNDRLAGGAGTDTLIGGDDFDTFVFSAWNVVIDKNGAIEHHAASPISDPDHIVDFQVDEISDIAEQIDTPTAGTATNYIETEIGYNAGYLEALKWADGQIGYHWMFGFVTDRVNGYLFGDLNNDGVLETGIVVEGLTSLDDFDYWYIV
jgi:Ca2+-binding RTX toxin-like protein